MLVCWRVPFRKNPTLELLFFFSMIESMKVGEPDCQDCNVLVVCFAFGCLILVTVAFQMDVENI